LFRGYGGARSGGGLEVRTYVNATGAILLIPFLGGRPLVTIPEGFFLQGSPEATEAAQGEQQVTQDADGTVDDGDDDGPDTPEVTVQKVTAPEDLDQSDSFFGVNQDFFGMTLEELGNYGEDFGETSEMLRYGGIAALAVPALAPVAMIVGAASQVTRANDVANLRAAAQIAEMRGYTDQAKTLNSRANQMVKDGGFLLKAMDKVGGINGDNIADKVMTSYTTIFDYGKKEDPEGLKREMFATTNDFVNVLKTNASKGYKWVDEGVVVDPLTGYEDVKGYYAIDEDAEEVEIPTADGGTVSVSVTSLPTTDDKDPRGVTFAGTTDSGVNVFEVTADSNIVRPKARPTDIGSDSTTTTTTTTAGSKDTNIASSGRSESDIQKDINNALSASGGEWTSELNDLVSERDSARAGEGTTTTTTVTSGNDNKGNDTSAATSVECCFIMLEARYGNGTMDKVVRKYRDEYMTDRNRRGYYRTAEVLVPLMRKSKTFKWIITKTFADPLVSYGKYYYGQNKLGVVFSPVKNFWMKVFDTVGGDTKFIRENGEVV